MDLKKKRCTSTILDSNGRMRTNIINAVNAMWLNDSQISRLFLEWKLRITLKQNMLLNGSTHYKIVVSSTHLDNLKPRLHFRIETFPFRHWNDAQPKTWTLLGSNVELCHARCHYREYPFTIFHHAEYYTSYAFLGAVQVLRNDFFLEMWDPPTHCNANNVGP